MLRLLVTFLFIASAATASARCKGVDLREHISPAVEEKLKAAAAKVPYAYGNHWIATKGDQKIHVIGTMHMGDGRMPGVARRLRPVIKKADLLMLEVTTQQMKERGDLFKSMRSVFFLPEGQKVQRMLPKEDWEQLKVELSVRGLSVDEINALKPWFLSNLIKNSNCGVRGLSSPKGLDARLEKAAKSARVPVMGLETSGTGYRAMSRQPMRDQVKLLQYELRATDFHNDEFITVREAYFEQAIVEGSTLSDWNMFKDQNPSRAEVLRLLNGFDKQLLEWRNRLWMPNLLKRPEKNIVVAVGAAHLPGRAGVLNLLAQKGYKLQRAEF